MVPSVGVHMLYELVSEEDRERDSRFDRPLFLEKWRCKISQAMRETNTAYEVNEISRIMLYHACTPECARQEIKGCRMGAFQQPRVWSVSQGSHPMADGRVL